MAGAAARKHRTGQHLTSCSSFRQLPGGQAGTVSHTGLWPPPHLAHTCLPAKPRPDATAAKLGGALPASLMHSDAKPQTSHGSTLGSGTPGCVRLPAGLARLCLAG